MTFLFVHSKSKASPIASRTRGSLNFSRRVLMNQPCAPEGVRSGSTSRFTRPSRSCRKIVARRPDARGELLSEEIVARGEALEGDVAVAIIFVAHDIEIVLAAGDGKIGAPPILYPLVFDEAAGLEAADAIGTGAERHFQRRILEIPRRIVGAREDRQAGDEQRNFPPALGREFHRERRPRPRP